MPKISQVMMKRRRRASHLGRFTLWHNGRRATQLSRFTLWHNGSRNFWKMNVLRDSANTYYRRAYSSHTLNKYPNWSYFHQDNILCSGVTHVGISDHSLVYAYRKISISSVSKGINLISYRQFKHFNSNNFRNDVSTQPWDDIKELYDPNCTCGSSCVTLPSLQSIKRF